MPLGSFVSICRMGAIQGPEPCDGWSGSCYFHSCSLIIGGDKLSGSVSRPANWCYYVTGKIDQEWESHYDFLYILCICHNKLTMVLGPGNFHRRRLWIEGRQFRAVEWWTGREISRAVMVLLPACYNWARENGYSVRHPLTFREKSFLPDLCVTQIIRVAGRPVMW